MLNQIVRILKFSWNDFWRNKSGNLTAVFVLAITIFLVANLFIFQGITQFLIKEIQERIDVAVYFKADANEEDILKTRDELLKFSNEIKKVQYVSKEEALQKFTEKHKDNPYFMKALEEVGQNPLLASLDVKTESPFYYEEVSKFLEASQFSNIIEKIDYSQKKTTIDKVFSLTSNINKFGIIISGVLILIAILVVFNTIKLTLNNSRDEIGTMKLVGASNWFIRGPFIIQGAICGLIACLICLGVLAVATYFLSSKLDVVLPGFNIFDYFVSNFWILVLIQVGFGVGLGVISSAIAIRTHLKI